MPNDKYKSKAQERFFHAAEERGEISKASVERHDKASKGKKLPEKLHPKKTVSKEEQEEKSQEKYEKKRHERMHGGK